LRHACVLGVEGMLDAQARAVSLRTIDELD
jgi:hypothetical protein